MNLLIDENMPRSLAGELLALGLSARDARDIGLLGHSDEEVFRVAAAIDAIIITRDRGFTYEKSWPPDFTAGVIFVNLPDDTPASIVKAKVTNLLTQRLPESLLGAITFIEPQRALSQIVRRRPKSSAKAQDNPDDPGGHDETLNAQLDEA
jgi:predicted nuclease of predicted toxin-antitoxin system